MTNTHTFTHVLRGFSRYVNVGLFYLRQLFFAKFDLKVHVDNSQSLLSSAYLFLPPLPGLMLM